MLCLIKHHAFLTLALHGYEWSVSSSGHLRTGKTASSINQIGGWVGIKASHDVVAKRESTCPYWEWNPICPVHRLLCILS